MLDFLSEQILNNMSPLVKCHPALKHFGDSERLKRGLQGTGYKTHLFLSERTKLKATVKREEKKDILIFAVFRTEYTSMARYEYLYHVRIQMDLDEAVDKVEYKEKKTWIDGELESVYMYCTCQNNETRNQLKQQ